ncbi:MAG: tyrosine-type recombinase/integrase [Pseudomonadota bacterium]
MKVLGLTQTGDGRWKWVRRVPEDLQERWGKKRLEKRLGRDETEAIKETSRLNAHFERQVKHLRGNLGEAPEDVIQAALGNLAEMGLSPGDWANAPRDSDLDNALHTYFDQHFKDEYSYDHDGNPVGMESRLDAVKAAEYRLLCGAIEEPEPSVLTLSAAKEFYEEQKGKQSLGSEKQRALAVRRVIEFLGDRPLDTYTRADVRAFVRHLADTPSRTGKTLTRKTIGKYVDHVARIFEKAKIELEPDRLGNNPWRKPDIPKSAAQSGRRVPLSDDEIIDVQMACREADDDRRWIIAMISDTGARLMEIVALRVEDVLLEHSTPHIRVLPYEARGLKTEASEKLVPLVGAALWGAKRALEQEGLEECLFPRYVRPGRDQQSASNSASGALNKWMQKRIGAEPAEGKTLHSFRHSMRVRLERVGASETQMGHICGWERERTIAQRYGDMNQLLPELHELMSQLALERPQGLTERP